MHLKQQRVRWNLDILIFLVTYTSLDKNTLEKTFQTVT